MFDESFRAFLGRAGAPQARALQRLGVTPNQITVAAAAVGVVAAVLVARGELVAGALVWVLSRVLDGYDGLLARISGNATLFGGYLDITMDMLAYSAMAIGFALAMPTDRIIWLFVMAGYVMAITTTLALSSLIERADRTLGGDRSIQFTAAPAEGGETTAVYVLLALFPASSRVVLLIWIALLAATLIGRTWQARRLLGSHRTA